MYTPAFYISKHEPLTWSQQLHNVGAELLHFPFIHKNYDLIDGKTLERSRITSINHAGKLFELVIKVMLAATVVFPIICFAISYPSASKTSWHQVDTLFSQLDPEQKKDFLYAFLTKKEIEQDAPFAQLHLIAESYRKSGIEADLISQLISLDASVFEEVKQWNNADETLYAEASAYVHQHDPKISVLYPFLSGANQIRILQQLQNREKDLLMLFPRSTTAALENPGQLLHCLIPRELRASEYGITLQGLPELFHTAWHLQRSIPKAYHAIEALLIRQPQALVLSTFWKIAKSIKPGIWGRDRKVIVDNLSQEERCAIKSLSFEEVLALHKFEQPWIKLWYLVGQTPERLSQTCFSILPDIKNNLRAKDNRENFLNILSHEDLRNLINEDPKYTRLSKIFGDAKKQKLKIPYALVQWWKLYKEVDYQERLNELYTFCTNKDFLQHFEARHTEYLRDKPFFDQEAKKGKEKMAFIKEQVNRYKYNYYPRAENFEHWRQADRAKTEKIQAEQTLHSNFKIALEYLGLNPKQAYTKEEILREFRLWSLKNHPDRTNTEGATERFQTGLNYKDAVIELLATGNYSKTPIC
jgi:hypothetical protein